MAIPARIKILLALDQSRQADEAVQYLTSLPLAGRVHVTLLHVRRNLPEALNNMGLSPGLHKKLEPERLESWLKQEKQAVELFMDTARRTLLTAGFPDNQVEVKTPEMKVGFARDIIAEAGRGYGAVVVGRAGLSKLKDAVMGSIAAKLVARLAQIPVWVVGGQPRGGKLLIAMDSSEGALKAVDHVAGVLGPGPQEVLLFHVIRSLEYGGQFVQGFIGDELEERLTQEGRKEMQAVFERARQRLVAAGLPEASVKTMLVTSVPSRAGAIADQAQYNGYDTIVVGRRGISKVEEFFIGRVSNKVLDFAKRQAVWVVN
ncbi:hypothetical protein AAU61_04375 [Desulfocarbo indianensis]|nr:hypothetical protein AAU61_04375 [Desulfocarbo indianensis]